tara:strand:+ start:70917 stop:71036 length:120 start_codon:yes stop_codon:yes gene_type:complete
LEEKRDGQQQKAALASKNTLNFKYALLNGRVGDTDVKKN